MNIKLALGCLITMSLGGCADQGSVSEKYVIPDVIYNVPDYKNNEADIFHPENFIENLSTKPENACEREELRRLIIAVNMYSVEFYNQSYNAEKSSTGVRILFDVFPTLMSVQDEERGMISIDKISHHLRKIESEC
jgi:AAA15 family ATPase/GTPase